MAGVTVRVGYRAVTKTTVVFLSGSTTTNVTIKISVEKLQITFTPLDYMTL